MKNKFKALVQITSPQRHFRKMWKEYHKGLFKHQEISLFAQTN